MRADTILLCAARRRTNGANVHRATQLIRGYENAVQLASDPRLRDRRGARQLVDRAEDALRAFCSWQGESDLERDRRLR